MRIIFKIIYDNIPTTCIKTQRNIFLQFFFFLDYVLICFCFYVMWTFHNQELGFFCCAFMVQKSSQDHIRAVLEGTLKLALSFNTIN